MKAAIFALLALVLLYGLHRLALWAEARGWIYYRKKHGGSGALSSAVLEVQSLFEPSKRYVLEEKRREQVEGEDSGEPPATTALRHAYDGIAAAYDRERRRAFRERPYLDRFVRALPGARILDVGCGTGAPIDTYLLRRGCAVTGIDASERMLSLARQNAPRATFLAGDMRTVALRATFDGVVAWDSLFHVPREEHAAMFRRLRSWLAPGGVLLLTLGGSQGDFTALMCGGELFYSSNAPQRSVELLEDAGFRVELQEIDDPSSRGHLVLLAVAV